MELTNTTAILEGAPARRATTLCEAFRLTVERVPDAVALRDLGGGELTWREYGERVYALAAGLAALGVGRGDTVAMMLTNRIEGHLVDTAALHLGATPFSIYNTSSLEQVQYLLGHAEARVAVTEAQFADRIEAVRDGLQLEHLFVVDGDRPLADLEALGEPGFDVDASAAAVTSDDLAVLIYTSGTTGPPKGVELTHASVIAEFRSAAMLVPVKDDGQLISYLPMAHAADRVCAHYPSMLTGSSVTCVPDPRTVMAALPEVRPSLFFTVPRMWEKLKAGLEARYGAGIANADDATKAKIRASLGLDQAELIATGSAPSVPEVLRFFEALGLPLCEAWSMTETSAAGCINPPGAIKLGTVGPVMPGMEIMVADDGELLLRGSGVMRGYRKEPELTSQTIDADGWLHTGDIGSIDEDGYVSILDRKKELIINASGKNMSPANIENAVKAESWLIGPVVAIGDNRPCITALIVLDPETSATFEGDKEAEVAAAVERANRRLSRVEQIKAYTILPDDWLPGGDELTPTMKLKRKPIVAKYAAEIEAMYA